MIKFREIVKGIILRDNATDPTDNIVGSFWYNSVAKRLKAYIDGAIRTFVTEDQSATLTNKTLDIDNNTLSNVVVGNLKAGVLQTSLSGSSTDSELPSAKASYDAANGVQTNLNTHAGLSSGVHGVVGTVVGTSDSQALTNKTFDVSLNTLSNVVVANLAAGVLDTDLTTVSLLDDTLPSAKATKSYADAISGGAATALNNHITNTTGAHASSAISYDPTISGLSSINVKLALDEIVSISATKSNPTFTGVISGPNFKTVGGTLPLLASQTNTNLIDMSAYKSARILFYIETATKYESFDIIITKRAADYKISTVSTGDASAISFDILSSGMITYSSGGESATLTYNFNGLL